jgi:hypothetical protein
MNGAQLHLALNHLPVVGVLIATLLLAGALIVRSDGVRRAALLLFAACGIAAAGAFFTGEPAEDGSENLPGVERTLIHDHEEFAEGALIGTAILAVLALGAVVVERKRAVPAWVAGVILVGGMGASGAMAWTAHLGGLIRHTELRAGFVAEAGEREK